MLRKFSIKKALSVITPKRVFLASLLLGLAFSLDSALAQATYNSLVKIPGMPTNPSPQAYLSGLCNFLIAVVGIVAMGAIIIGGARYLTSAGNPSAISEAKETIAMAIYGLILALVSWVIIFEINPDILVLKKPAMPWGPAGYSPGGENPLNNCTSPGEQDKTTSPCHCVDDPKRDVAFTQPVLTGPYVVSTSIAPCAVGVPADTKSITFTFNEPLNSSTIVTTNANSNLITVLGGLEYTPSTAVTAALNGNDLVITWPGSILNTGTRHTFIIRGIVNQSGSPNDAWVKNLSGVGMARNYWVTFALEPAFTGIACSSALPSVVTCRAACSDNYTPSVPNLNPAGYHCIKADLRVGSTFMPTGKQVSVKVGETVYFDGRTYSVNYAYPNLKTDVSSDGPGFDNGVDSYEIDFTTPWLGWTSDYAAAESINCNFLVGAISGLGTVLFDITYTKGMVSTSYAKAGKYEGLLRIQSKNGCYEAFDRVQIDVNP